MPSPESPPREDERSLLYFPLVYHLRIPPLPRDDFVQIPSMNLTNTFPIDDDHQPYSGHFATHFLKQFWVRQRKCECASGVLPFPRSRFEDVDELPFKYKCMSQ
jgi:hypothetical protein